MARHHTHDILGIFEMKCPIKNKKCKLWGGEECEALFVEQCEKNPKAIKEIKDWQRRTMNEQSKSR